MSSPDVPNSVLVDLVATILPKVTKVVDKQRLTADSALVSLGYNNNDRFTGTR